MFEIERSKTKTHRYSIYLEVVLNKNGTRTHLASSMDTEHMLTFSHKILSSLSLYTTQLQPRSWPHHPGCSHPGHHFLLHYQAAHHLVSKLFLSVFYSVYLTIKSPLSLAPKTAFTKILLLCSFVKKKNCIVSPPFLPAAHIS